MYFIYLGTRCTITRYNYIH